MARAVTTIGNDPEPCNAGMYKFPCRLHDESPLLLQPE